MNKEVHQQVSETMQSLDGLQPAEANPFLWSKIKARLAVATYSMPQQMAWRMVVALVVIIVLNVVTLLNAGTDKYEIKSGPELFATEYSLTLPQSY